MVSDLLSRMSERQGEFSGDGAFPYSTFTRQNQNHVLHLLQIPFLWDTCTCESFFLWTRYSDAIRYYHGTLIYTMVLNDDMYHGTPPNIIILNVQQKHCISNSKVQNDAVVLVRIQNSFTMLTVRLHVQKQCIIMLLFITFISKWLYYCIYVYLLIPTG